MFIMLHIHVSLWFHCGFTGAHLWKRSAFLLGLGKGISFLSESLYNVYWQRHALSSIAHLAAFMSHSCFCNDVNSRVHALCNDKHVDM